MTSKLCPMVLNIVQGDQGVDPRIARAFASDTTAGKKLREGCKTGGIEFKENAVIGLLRAAKGKISAVLDDEVDEALYATCLVDAACNGKL